jgi:hypothetical protein
MNRTYLYVVLLLLSSAGMLTLPQLCRPARSYSGEFAYAACVDNLNCGNCLLGWLDDPQCASGMACGAFRIPGGFGGNFKACSPTGNVNNWCNTGVAGQTIHTCSNGFYQWCACVNAGGDCPPSVNCNCNWAMPTGPMPTFLVNSVCY